MIIISVGSGGVVSAFFRFNSNSNEMNIISLLSHFNHTEKLLGRSRSTVENLFWVYIFWQHQKQSNVECRKRDERGERWGKINEDNSASSPMKRHKFSQENCLYNYFKLSKVYHLKMRFLFAVSLRPFSSTLAHNLRLFGTLRLRRSSSSHLYIFFSGAFSLLFHEKIEFLVLFQFLFSSWVLLTPRPCHVCSLSTLCAYSLLKFNIRLNELSRKKFFSSFMKLKHWELEMKLRWEWARMKWGFLSRRRWKYENIFINFPLTLLFLFFFFFFFPPLSLIQSFEILFLCKLLSVSDDVSLPPRHLPSLSLNLSEKKTFQILFTILRV